MAGAQRPPTAVLLPTLASQVGWLVTAANLGDSRAIIDTGVELHHLTGARHAARMGCTAVLGGPKCSQLCWLPSRWLEA